MGAVAAPVVGALGAVSRVTEGVDASTSYFDPRRKNTNRRRARVAGPDGTLPCLEGDGRTPIIIVDAGHLDLHIEDDGEEEYDEEVSTTPSR